MVKDKTIIKLNHNTTYHIFYKRFPKTLYFVRRIVSKNVFALLHLQCNIAIQTNIFVLFVVELLLQHKADVSTIDNSQNTALHYACMHVSGTGKHINGTCKHRMVILVK